MKIKLYNEDCREAMKKIGSRCVDTVVTDPPYELGFMGKKWDKSEITYDVEMWKEVRRIMKPGAHLLVFGGTRTYHRMACAVEDAGFEIRDTIHWTYGSGFPKSLDVGKAIDKKLGKKREKISGGRGPSYQRTIGNTRPWMFEENHQIDGPTPATEAAKKWDGWGTALKPAHELILVARKPLSEPNVASNVLKWGTGGINVDGCRVGNELLEYRTTSYREATTGEFSGQGEVNYTTGQKQVQGRWPANFLLSHSEGCVRRGEKRVKGTLIEKPCPEPKISGHKWGTMQQNRGPRGYGNPNGLETVEDWECVDGCPVKLLDGQSGIHKSCGGTNPGKLGKRIYGKYSLEKIGQNAGGLGDIGGASRFFKTFEYEPFYYCAKVSRKEREEGLKGQVPCVECGKKDSDTHSTGKGKSKCHRNNHPTVKPIKLLRYLCKLVTPPNGIVLDNFMGSGSTGVACAKEDFSFIGMEKEKESFEIAEMRIRASLKESE